MNCNCISMLEKDIAKHMKPEAGDNATATCMGAGFALGTDMVLTLNIPFRVHGSKKGYKSLHGKEMNVVASYCPFCGKSTKKPQNDTAKQE